MSSNSNQSYHPNQHNPQSVIIDKKYIKLLKLFSKKQQQLLQQQYLQSKQQKEQKQTLQKYIQDENSQLNAQQLIGCPLCGEIIISSNQTHCGHNFCQYCLKQYLLVCQECPICAKKIRQKNISTNKRIDQFIQQFYQFLSGQELQYYNIRKQQHKKYKNSKKLQLVCTGAMVDVRDDEYYWRKGRIVRTFNRLNSQQGRVKFLIIQYLDNGKKQQFPANCHRLAKPNFYTSRNDIPKFQQYQISNSDNIFRIKFQQMNAKKEQEDCNMQRFAQSTKKKNNKQQYTKIQNQKQTKNQLQKLQYLKVKKLQQQQM